MKIATTFPTPTVTKFLFRCPRNNVDRFPRRNVLKCHIKCLARFLTKSVSTFLTRSVMVFQRRCPRRYHERCHIKSAKRSTATHPMVMAMAMALGTGTEVSEVSVDLTAGSLAKEETRKTRLAGGVIPVKTLP